MPLQLLLQLPPQVLAPASATIGKLHVRPGAEVPRGGALLDITVTLGGTASHDCPPITHLRLHSREAARLLRWHAAPGETVPGGALIAVLEGGVPAAADRALRFTLAGIIPDFGV